MLTWEPIHPNHAVERLRFEILFSEPLPRKIIEAVGAVFDAKRSDLRFDPREERQVQHFFVGPNPGIMPQEPMIQNGWQSIRKSAANIPLEAVTFDSSNIVYESTDYRGWQKAFVRFESVCSDMLKAAGEAVNARAIVHDYVDRFVYDGPAGEAVPTEIVRKEFLPQFPKTILMGEELWHSHRGWFEYFDGEKFLINQNLDAQQGQTIEGRDARSIQVYTKLQLHAANGGLELSLLDTKFQHMHKRCNELVAAVVTKETAIRIGLGGKSNV